MKIVKNSGPTRLPCGRVDVTGTQIYPDLSLVLGIYHVSSRNIIQIRYDAVSFECRFKTQSLKNTIFFNTITILAFYQSIDWLLCATK